MGTYQRYRGYQDSKGRWWKNRRPNGWTTDNKAPDGYTVDGYRRVDADRRVRFAGCYWHHPDLVPGSTVNVILECCWGTAISLYPIDETRFNPDTIGDDPRAFIEHSHDIMRRITPENVGDTNKRPVSK